MQTKDLFDTSFTLAKSYLESFEKPYEALPGLKAYLYELMKTLDKDQYDEIKPNVFVHKTSTIYESAYIHEPCIIGAYSEVRHGAFIRGSVLVGEHCVIGNSVEVKNAILFDHVQVPHFNYVGDSILGHYAHMGAGSITSNVKNDKTCIKYCEDGQKVDTGLKKFGALLGDHVEVGCNSVLNPGTIVYPNTSIYPLSFVRGVLKGNSILKNNGEIVEKK